VAEANTYTGPRWLAYVMGAIGLIAVVIGAIHTPFGEWTASGYLLAGVLVVVSILWIVVGLRGPVNLLGNMKGRTALIVSVVGALIAGVLLGVNIFTDEWTLSTILFTGLWAQLAVMFIGSISVSSRKMKDGN
jgi:hypothetical protein